MEHPQTCKLPSLNPQRKSNKAGDSNASPCAGIGLKIGVLPIGELNAITDVSGVAVGQTTIVKGDNVRTGITAILPHGGNLFQEKVPGAVFVGNGFGKLAGSTQVNELGEIETPILLTSTLAVPKTGDFCWTTCLIFPVTKTFSRSTRLSPRRTTVF